MEELQSLDETEGPSLAGVELSLGTANPSLQKAEVLAVPG